MLDLEETDSSFKRIIASTAYNHGIDDDQIRKIYQIELRDRILNLSFNLQAENSKQSCTMGREDWGLSRKYQSSRRQNYLI